MLHAMPSSNGVRNAVRIALWSCLLALSPLTSFAAPSITLAWDPSPDPSVVGYKVYWGVATRNYTNSLSAGSATTLTISNLVVGPTYYFAATAYDTNGIESDYSVEASGAVVLPNQQPTLNVISPVTINEGAGTQTVNLSGITSGATNENQTLTVTATSSNTGLIPNPTVNYTSPSTTGTLTFAPVAFQNGTSTITVTVNDGAASNNIVSRTFVVTVNSVNQAPTLNALTSVTIQENSGPQTVNLSGITSGATNENQTLTVTATSSNTGLIPNPTVSYTSPNATGSITFAPVALGVGNSTITVSVNDGGASNNIISRTFTVTVNGVNQQPTLTQPADVVANENAGNQTVNLTGISSGATNEFQTLTITATSSNTGLIPNPTVNYTSPNSTGSLTFAPLGFGFGNSTITVTVNDGGTSNNIVSRTFVVTVNAVNQPPTLDPLADVTINENATLQTVGLTGISSGATNESQVLSVNASSSNTGLIPAPTVTYTSPNSTASLSFKPVTNQFGTATVTVTVRDSGTSNNLVTRTFNVTVNAVNQPPLVSTITNRVIAVSTSTAAIPFTVSDAETPAGSLTVSASSDNLAVVPVSGIVFGGSGGNRTVTVTPAAGQTGVASITITVSDGTDSSSTTFQLTVAPKPAAPGNFHLVSQ
jgi:hypothetical protein